MLLPIGVLLSTICVTLQRFAFIVEFPKVGMSNHLAYPLFFTMSSYQWLFIDAISGVPFVKK